MSHIAPEVKFVLVLAPAAPSASRRGIMHAPTIITVIAVITRLSKFVPPIMRGLSPVMFVRRGRGWEGGVGVVGYSSSQLLCLRGGDTGGSQAEHRLPGAVLGGALEQLGSSQ